MRAASRMSRRQCRMPSPATAVWTRDRVVDVKHTKIDIKLDIPAKASWHGHAHSRTLNESTRFVQFDGIDLQVTPVRRPAAGGVFVRWREAPRGLAKGANAGPTCPCHRVQRQPSHRYVLHRAGRRLSDQAVQAGRNAGQDTPYWLPCFDHPSEKQTRSSS